MKLNQKLLGLVWVAAFAVCGCSSPETVKTTPGSSSPPPPQKAQGMSASADRPPPLVNGSMLGPHPKPGSKEAREAAKLALQKRGTPSGVPAVPK